MSDDEKPRSPGSEEVDGGHPARYGAATVRACRTRPARSCALPEFAGTASPRPDPAVQTQVGSFIGDQYVPGRSLRELAELTDRSFSAVRNILAKCGVRRRSSGAAAVQADAVLPGTAGDWPPEPPMLSAGTDSFSARNRPARSC